MTFITGDIEFDMRRKFFSDMLDSKNRSLNYWMKQHNESKCSDIKDEILYIKDAIKALDGDDEFGTICICAVRYALGRETYMPTLVQNFVKRHINELSTGTLEIMRCDVMQADSMFGGYGDEKIDKPQWMYFMNYLNNEIRKREDSNSINRCR